MSKVFEVWKNNHFGSPTSEVVFTAKSHEAAEAYISGAVVHGNSKEEDFSIEEKEEEPLVNKDNTLTVAHLIKATADGRVSTNMPIGIVVRDQVLGINCFEVYTYADGSQCLVMHMETARRPVATSVGDTSFEVGNSRNESL